jgi:hypothetical protein
MAIRACLTLRAPCEHACHDRDQDSDCGEPSPRDPTTATAAEMQPAVAPAGRMAAAAEDRASP